MLRLDFVGAWRGLDWVKVILNPFQFLFSDFFHWVSDEPFHTNILPLIINNTEFLE